MKSWVVAITYTHRAADEIHERIENSGRRYLKALDWDHPFLLSGMDSEALRHLSRTILDMGFGSSTGMTQNGM